MSLICDGTTGSCVHFAVSDLATKTVLFSVWFKTNSNTGLNRYPLNVMDPGSVASAGKLLNGLFNSASIASLASGGSATTVNNFSTDTWSHAGCYFESSAVVTAWLDGDTENKGRDASGVPASNTTTRVGMGCLADSTPGQAVDGWIAHAAVWDWSSSEAAAETAVVSLAGGTNPQDITGGTLVCYAPLTEDLSEIVTAGSVTEFGTASFATDDNPTVAAAGGGGGAAGAFGSFQTFRFFKGF